MYVNTRILQINLIHTSTMCCSVNGSVCLLNCVFVNCVCELFGETIRNVFGCGCYFVVECNGSV